MTESEALELLKYHSYNHEDFDNPKAEIGFLGMLRPFQGELYEDNFHDLMTILRVLKNEFKNDKLNRQIVSSFWGICHLSRAWGLNSEGMLRRNNLITEKQIQLLSVWIDCISTTIMNLLEGLNEEEAFESYKFYLKDAKDSL